MVVQSKTLTLVALMLDPDGQHCVVLEDRSYDPSVAATQLLPPPMPAGIPLRTPRIPHAPIRVPVSDFEGLVIGGDYRIELREARALKRVP